MFDDLLNTGSTFDWISPLLGFVNDFLYGPPADFGIPSNAGWGRREISRLLSQYGIQVWGIMLNVSGDNLMFTVSQHQAKWAYYILKQADVPLTHIPGEATKS